MEKDTKEQKKRTAPAVPRKKRASLGEYMRGVRTEMKKVVWPTRKEMGTFTTVVILACTFFALFFAAIDYLVILGLSVSLGIELG